MTLKKSQFNVTDASDPYITITTDNSCSDTIVVTILEATNITTSP